MSVRHNVLSPPLSGHRGNEFSQRPERLRELQVTRRFVGQEIEVRHDLLIVLSKDGSEHHLQDHEADVASDIDALFLSEPPLPIF